MQVRHDYKKERDPVTKTEKKKIDRPAIMPYLASGSLADFMIASKWSVVFVR